MKAFAMLKAGTTGWIDLPRPSCGPFDAIVRPLAVAPCTSDIHTLYENSLGAKDCIVLGHECAGVVDEIGSEVRDFRIGDRVIVPAITPDWRTREIANGTNHCHCSGMLSGWKFSNIKHGVFADYVHVNDADMNLAHWPHGVTPAQAVMMSDMMSTGFHGAELARIKFGAACAVIGIGPVGLMAVRAAFLRGAGRIFAVGNRKVCADLAVEFGATDIVDYRREPATRQIMEATAGEGVDHVIIAGGPPEVLTCAVEICKPGGVVGNVNYFSSGEFLPLPRRAWGSGMAHKQLNGGLTPGGRGRMERMANLVRYKRCDPGKLVTHIFKGSEHIPEALELMHHKPPMLIKPLVLLN